MGGITVAEIQHILQEENLLREVVSPAGWTFSLTDQAILAQTFDQLDYHSGRLDGPSIFICKGAAFKEEYLHQAIENGAQYYISEVDYPAAQAVGFIVSDERRAMASVARKFYNCPDEKLYMIGITGTKGKTTVNYFLHHILQAAFPQEVGYLSTIDYTLDGKTRNASQLTTPESVDLYRMLAQAVANGIKYMVMEVSSQAYKLDRVYGLFFDRGLFLNFTPDHIGPLEHPSMEDYFYCKRQLLHHARHILLHDDLPHQQLLIEEAHAFGADVSIYGTLSTSDYVVELLANKKDTFTLYNKSTHMHQTFHCPLPGDFNMENAAAAIIVAQQLHIDDALIKEALVDVVVPGRMMEYHLPNGVPVYIDYAHNYDSLRRLLDYVSEQHQDRQVHLLLGATGDKGKSRRIGFAEALSGRDISVCFTADDPGTESPRAIANEILAHLEMLGTPLSDYDFIEDRAQAVQTLLEEAAPSDVIILAGKGIDQSQIIGKAHVDYPGDFKLVERFILNEENKNKGEML
ncbi:UDP-N-acetylmuramyl-tripeptide synthetase [Allofustis seminis]|uniref:UDP-N-acetylmuramyl-tripeptide synthetase n=1 Tax=Allofustis seminis TaxID=166939 RepID=UPI000372E2F3|nr:UDP-N-acetylmuramyl-tripeptide synthetase [Allofustis seminis]